MRAHIHPSLKHALSTGIVDIDIIVHTDPHIFESLGTECFIYMKHILAHQGINAEPL